MAIWATEDDSHRKAHGVSLFVFSFLATVAVLLRIWGRKIQKQSLMLNDYLTALGLVFALAETGVNVYGCCFPLEWKSTTQSEDIKLGLQLSFLSPIIWVTAVTIIRSSIITLYIHLFPTRRFRLVCFGVLALNIIFFFSTVLADCLICRPISSKWDFSVKGSCGNQKPLDLYIAIMNMIQDVTVLILPMPILWRLQMATKRKMSLSCIFGIGIAICAVTAYRVQVTTTIGDPHIVSAQEAYSLIALLASLETLLGIISACLPMMRPIVKKLYDVFQKRGTNSTVTNTSGSIPILMRISHMVNVSSKKHGWNKYASALESSELTAEYHGARASPEFKADRVLGIKAAEIHVQKDVDIESVMCKE